jgi:hypothetical protein
MNGDEMKLVSDGKREVEEVLALRSLGQGVRSRLQRALDRLQAALDYGEDERGSGGTDGD